MMVSKTGLQKSAQFQLMQMSYMRDRLPPEPPLLDREAREACSE